MKTIKSRTRFTDSRHSQSQNSHLSDQKWNSHSRESRMNWDLKNHHHWKIHSSNNQEAHQECFQKIQKNNATQKRNHRSNTNRQNRIEKLSSQNRNDELFAMFVRSSKTNDASYTAEVLEVRRSSKENVSR